MIPALLVCSTLLGTVATSTKTSNSGFGGGSQTTGVAFVTAILGWFAAIFTGRMPRGLRDAGAYAVGYRAQLLAYVAACDRALPERRSDRDARPRSSARPHIPVHVVGDAERPAPLARDRAFRLPLLIPLLVWLSLWGVLAALAAIVQWLVHARRGAADRRAPPLPLALCPLPLPRPCVPLARREPVPGLHRAARQLPARPRASAAGQPAAAGRHCCGSCSPCPPPRSSRR